MKKVIITERVADEAVEKLKTVCDVDVKLGLPREDLLACIADYEAIIVRSATQIDAELMDVATNLKVVGRAGNGTDNIKLEEATKRGIIVANTPESNTMSAAELTVGLILAQSRNIAQANTFLKGGEWGRNQFKGSELYKKTLGVVGLGRIGSLVATRMKAFDMEVIAYDPYITDERFTRYKVEKVDKLEELIERSDYITVHTPRNKETFHMINEEHLDLLKDNVRLTNVARGGIIAEKLIVEGIKAGKIASAGIDVHEQEPSNNTDMFDMDNVVVTPHLGASTDEAQLNVGMTVVNQVIAALEGEIVPNAVNLPTLHRDELDAIKPYINLGEKLGKMYYQLFSEPIETIKIEYWGDIANADVEMISIAFIKGLLETITSNRVNYINAMVFAEKRGIAIEERKLQEYYNGYTDFVRFRLKYKGGEFILGGNLSSKQEGRLVDFNGYEVDMNPGDRMIAIQNMDTPGVIGRVGTILGSEEINVATMQLGRFEKGEKALMLLNVDEEVQQGSLDLLEAQKDILWAKGLIL